MCPKQFINTIVSKQIMTNEGIALGYLQGYNRLYA